MNDSVLSAALLPVLCTDVSIKPQQALTDVCNLSWSQLEADLDTQNCCRLSVLKPVSKRSQVDAFCPGKKFARSSEYRGTC